MITFKEITDLVEKQKNSKVVEGMVRFGINIEKAYGIPIPILRKIAKKTVKENDRIENHLLAQQLWASEIHELRILASMIDDPSLVDENQMEEWVEGFNSWDICDQCCGNLFDKTKYAYEKALEWTDRDEEYVKRAGFALMAILAVHDKKASDEEFLEFLKIIKANALEKRNFVKKAINWALRQIGKRNANLNQKAVDTANEMLKSNSKIKWIASDVLKELTNDYVQRKIRSRKYNKDI